MCGTMGPRHAPGSREDERSAAMNLKETRRYEMLVRVDRFGTEHADAFPAGTVGSRMFAAVAAAIAGLADGAACRMSGEGHAREAVTSKAMARETLRRSLGAIHRTA